MSLATPTPAPVFRKRSAVSRPPRPAPGGGALRAIGKRLAALLGLAFLALPAAADDLPAAVAQALRAASIPESSVAVVVQPVDARAPLIAHNAARPMNPASVMKLVTTYAALDLLGPAHTWKTSAWTGQAAVNGVLSGNLYLKGGGDPHFAIEQLWALLRQLRVRGIRRIAGDIVLDRSVFDVPAVDPGAFDDKPMRPYNVGPNGLLINFQAMRFTLQPAPRRPRLLQETPSDGLVVVNRLRSTDDACGDWKARIDIRLLPAADGQRLEFSGPFSGQCGEKTLNLSPLDAEHQASGLIRALWRELGGSLAGRVRDGSLPADATLVAEHESEPLADAIRQINKYSNNVMARQVFLSVGNGAEASPGGAAPATAERARQRIADWLAGRGLIFPELDMDNGCGLSREARISAGSLDGLLLDAWRHPLMPEFVSSLPIVGIDGTMKKRLKESEATGRAHIKTGTLDGVRSAAGYALDAAGRTYAVSFLINDPNAGAGGPAIDALLLWIAERRATGNQTSMARTPDSATQPRTTR